MYHDLFILFSDLGSVDEDFSCSTKDLQWLAEFNCYHRSAATGPSAPLCFKCGPFKSSSRGWKYSVPWKKLRATYIYRSKSFRDLLSTFVCALTLNALDGIVWYFKNIFWPSSITKSGRAYIGHICIYAYIYAVYAACRAYVGHVDFGWFQGTFGDLVHHLPFDSWVIFRDYEAETREAVICCDADLTWFNMIRFYVRVTVSPYVTDQIDAIFALKHQVEITLFSTLTSLYVQRCWAFPVCSWKASYKSCSYNLGLSRDASNSSCLFRSLRGA